MQRILTLLVCCSVAVSLSACNLFGDGGQGASSSSASAASSEDIRETRNVTYRGTVEALGTTIYMQGTHALTLGDGRMLILESTVVDLEAYLNHEVEAFGALRPTVEAGGIIMRVERITDLSPESSVSSQSSASSKASSVASSVLSSAASSTVSSAARSRSSAAFTAQSSAPSSVAASSKTSTAANNTAPAASAEMEARIVLMSKQDLEGRNWTQQYCTDHVGFCVPVHRNWWFVSFGNTTSTLWHVEISSESIENMGSGPISINLVGGALSGHTDGQVATSGGIVTGYRSWTQGRHFEITADARLEAAVRYMTENLRATE